MTKTFYPIRGGAESFPFILDGIRENSPMTPLDCSGGLAVNSLMLFSRGSCTVKLPDGEHVLKQDSVCFTAAKIPFSLQPSDGGIFARYLTFRCNDGLPEQLGFGSFFAADDVKTDRIFSDFDDLLTAATDALAGADDMSVKLYRLLLDVNGAVFRRDEEKYGTGDIIRQAVAFMDKYCGQDITLERLAVISGVSLQHFCRVFKAKIGMRPMEYLARRRTAEAGTLLAQTDMKIGEIAQSVGFDDPNYFGITFRKYEGVTPTEYRKNLGK